MTIKKQQEINLQLDIINSSRTACIAYCNCVKGEFLHLMMMEVAQKKIREAKDELSELSKN